MELALLLKPLVVPAYVGFVAAVHWILFRIIPDSRFKAFLLKPRDGTSYESPKETLLVLAIFLGGLAGLVTWFVWSLK